MLTSFYKHPVEILVNSFLTIADKTLGRFVSLFIIAGVVHLCALVFGAGQHELSVAVDVERHEKPSATR